MSRILDHIQSTYQDFLYRLYQAIDDAGIDVFALKIDHLCYRVDSIELYEAYNTELAEAGFQLVAEPRIIGGRPIAVWKLTTPLLYQHNLQHILQSIDLLELPAPKPDHNYKNGLQHAEFVVHEPLENFIKKYPNLTWDLSGFGKTSNRDVALVFGPDLEVKFHEQSLETVILSE